jgi:hypothetical protein
MSHPEWLSILKLAMLWEMENMHKLAVKQILELPATTDDWIEMLKMSSSQGVSEIREMAINKLDSLGSVDRILLGRECRIYEWLLRGYRELVEQIGNISEKDESRLGGKTTLSLFRLSSQYWQNCGYRNGFNTMTAIHREFEEELKDAGCSIPSSNFRRLFGKRV